jgi:hypothetical protein
VDATGVVVAASSAVAVLWQVITGNVPQIYDGRLWLVAQGRWAANSALAGAPSTEGTGAKWDATIHREAAGEHHQQRGVGCVVDGGYGRWGGCCEDTGVRVLSTEGTVAKLGATVRGEVTMGALVWERC